MMKEKEIEWMYFLNLDGSLPRSFFSLDFYFKKENISLIPISLDQLLSMSTETDRVNVVCLISSSYSKDKYFKSNSRLLKMLSRNNKINLFTVSSYSSTNMENYQKKMDNYKFYRLPISSKELSHEVSEALEKQRERDLKQRFYHQRR